MKNSVEHFEIRADDMGRAKAFYENMFGWQIAAPPGFDDYWVIQTDPEGKGIGGGLTKRAFPMQGMVNYVTVESIDDSLKQATELGGEVFIPKQPVPGMGWSACCKDTEGNVLGLWEEDPSAA